MLRRGRKSAAQTPAPKSERIYGSKKNKKGSAASKKSGSTIKLNDKIVKSLTEKAREYNENHSGKVTVPTLKAVYRRGLGAYSSSHRPTITGGVPNSRNAWAMARVNKFLLKKSGKKVKAAYVQDDDLMAKGGKVFNDKELLAKYKRGESIGFTGIAHLKAKGLIERADGTKRKSYGKGGLIAPNGKPSKLNAEQYALVRTPEFKAWFGDWENSPETASKVVDEETKEPLVVYHGTTKGSFYVFTEKGSVGDLHGKAFYFTEKKNYAEWYAKLNIKNEEDSYIFNVFLNVKKPYSYKSKFSKKQLLKYVKEYPSQDDIDDIDDLISSYVKSDKEEDISYYLHSLVNISELLENLNYDGLRYGWEWVCYYPNQIKLADGTNTTFDANNPDIRFAKGGKTKGGGDCYYMAGQFAMNNFFTPKKIDYIGTPYLIHAEVQGQGRLENIRYGHAWIEDDIFVYDFSNNRELKIPKDFYYSLGNVDTTNPLKYRKYTFQEARRKMVDTGHYGCWDLEVEYADGGKVDDGKANFGKPPIPYDQIPFIHEAEKQNVEDILKNGFKIGTNPYITTGVYTIPIVYKQNKFDETNRTQELAIYLKKGSKIFWTNSERPTDYYRGYGNKFYEKLYSQLNSGHKTPRDDWNNKETQRDFCRRMEKWLFENGYVGVQQGGEIVITDLNAIQDIDIFDRYANGGEVDNYIFCENCGWNWKESETTEDDKYICHKCQHDNETSYIMSKLKKPKTITELSAIHNVPEQELESQLQKGIKTEMEHTTDKKIAETIALHHIEEMPDYYDKLQEMENPIVKLYSKSTKELKDGGVVVGKRHSESDENGSGEKFLVKSTGQVVELEGGEGVLCKNSMESDRKFTFENRTMTGREIASFLNHKYGGVEFAKGGEVNHVCGCKMFYHGGELPSATVEELEGGEAVITVKTMESKDKYNFNGTKMTPRKILSQINGLSGGKKFDEGGVIDLRKHKMENEKTLTKMVYFTEKILYSK